MTPNDNAQKVDPMPTNNAKGLEALAERVEGLCTEWGDMDEREKRDAIAADLRSHGAAIAELIEADKEYDEARRSEADTDGLLRREDARARRAAALRQVEGK